MSRKKVKAHLDGLYSKPLPVAVQNPVPPCILQNPISVLYFLYRLIVPSWPNPVVVEGTLVPGIRAVTVSDPEHMRILWQQGFFGKGTLSRSEPTYETRVSGSSTSLAAEDLTFKRREERRKFKFERAKEEERTRLKRMDIPDTDIEIQLASFVDPSSGSHRPVCVDSTATESLQLMACEALFLSEALGALKVAGVAPGTLLESLTGTGSPAPDHQTLLEYVAYHHFRSKGWCVRSGVKFGADFLLYSRGPVFTHAEFAVVLIPNYQNEDKNKSLARPWHWQSCVGRVIGGAKKTLILCYITVPGERSDLPLLERLGHYKVQEVVYRRWVPSRDRELK